MLNRAKEFNVDYLTKKGMGIYTFGALVAPKELYECKMLSTVMVDYTYVSTAKENFCDSLPA